MQRRGFTLVELLVAVVLLATGLVAAATAISAVTRAQASALRRTTAARLAEAKLTEIQTAGITSGAGEGTFAELDPGQMAALGAGGSNSAGSQAGQALAASDLSDYSYQWEITSGDFEGLARVQVSVWYRDNEQNPFTLIWYSPSP
jgi:prepilin-type N-terminal cleavage/methylation domain-containing protein